MKKIKRIIFLFLVLSITIFSKEGNLVVRIGSFNTLHLGWKSKYLEEKLKKESELISNFDIVAIQEVMKKDGVKKIVKILEKTTKEKWKYEISPYAVGSKKYREFYAFIYKADKVKKIRKGKFYPEKERKNDFIREPYGVKFQVGDFKFTYVTIHTIYGKKKKEREIEASELLDVYNFYKETYKEKNEKSIVIIGGDFNIPSTNKAFSQLYEGKDGIRDGVGSTKTTIGTKGLASSYDHIFYPEGLIKDRYIVNGGKLDFTNNNYKEVRKKVSDHLPVFIEIKRKK